MEHHLGLNKKPRDQKSSRTLENAAHPQASHSLKLQEKLKTEKPGQSYADFHHVITKNVRDVPPKSSWNQQKQQISRKATREEELVKYMSSVPSYLERREKPQERVLNVGVLDWRLLEKWQYSKKQMSSRSSSSNTSPYFSTDGSSIQSSRRHSCSPSHERMRHPSLQYHLMASPAEGPSSSATSSSQGEVGKFQDLRAAQSNSLSGKLKSIPTDSRSIPRKVSYEVVSSPKGKMKTRDGDFESRAEDLKEPKSNRVSQDVPERQKTVVLLLPRDDPLNNQSGVCQASGQRSTEESRISFSKRSKEAYHAELKSDIPHSCPLPHKVYSNEFSQKKQPGYIGAESIQFPPVSRSAKIGISPSKARNVQQKDPTIIEGLDTKASRAGAGNAYEEMGLKASKTAAEKPRSISPFSLFRIGMGKTGKSSSSMEGSNAPQLRSTSVPAKSVSENYTSLDCSSNDKSNSSSKARTSPLRRLLDPLMKPPKAANSRQLSDPSKKTSISTDGACRSSNLQALLRVSVKNGLPLFTFAVDNDTDIFAATMKLSTSRKDDHSCIYTFFTVREVKKKKGGWISQGGKGKTHDYIPDAVAQMKVFDGHLSNFTKPNFADHFRVKEFVLFSVKLGEEDHETPNFQPNDELAAIVVKLPKKMHRNSVGNGCQSNNFTGASLEGDFPKARRYSYSGDDGSDRSLVSDQEGIKTTVILPSGIHSLPSKGEPSSLVQRWITGGSCDCGGWDLGCKLKVLVNSNPQSAKKSSSSSVRDQFELFFQDGVEENRAALRLALFEDGIFSVEFNSSLTLLQAFSTCIAILDGRNLCGLSESNDLFEEKDSQEIIFANQAEGEAPARYVSNPPLSPVGRV